MCLLLLSSERRDDLPLIFERRRGERGGEGKRGRGEEGREGRGSGKGRRKVKMRRLRE